MMSKLKPLNGTELNEYVINLLQKHGISTVREFLNAEIPKVCKIINLSGEQLLAIKRRVREHYGPVVTNLRDMYAMAQRCRTEYHTGIASLDNLFHDAPFSTGSIWEICGFAGVGKSQICLTIVNNFISKYDRSALYIDTKCDLIGKRMRQMFGKHNIDKAKCGRVMSKMKVERVLSAHHVVDVLEQLLKLLNSNNEEVQAIQLVVIDALPAVWYNFFGDSDRIEGNYLLTVLANLIYQLASKYFIAFLLVNLSVAKEEQVLQIGQRLPGEDNQNTKAQLDDDMDVEPSTSNRSYIAPALGHYWQSVPHVRLVVELPSEQSTEPTERVVRVLKSCYSATGVSCRIRITDAGVI